MMNTELHAMHLYVIECEKRNNILASERKGDWDQSAYPLAVHQHRAYAGRIRGYSA